MSGGAIESYPDLVDTIWDRVKGAIEERERADYRWTEPQVTEALGLQWSWSDEACTGIAQAISDLVDLGYARGRSRYNEARWSAISPSADAPEESPSAHVLAQGIVRLPPFRARALRYMGERSLRQESGIIFFVMTRVPFDEMIRALLPDMADAFQARGQVVEAVNELERQGFLRGPGTMGAFNDRVTLLGACWLQIGAPLLDLIDRAAKLPKHPEALAAARKVMEAYTRSEQDAARDITVAIEMLENAVGGDRALPGFLGQPRPFVSDLKQSAQMHRHATTPGREVLNHAQRLTQMREIMDLYVSKREAEAP